jgi:hypothetical protein
MIMLQERPAYQKLVDLIKDKHNHTITEQEAHFLARNLMGYTELAIRIGTRTQTESSDHHRNPKD